MSRNMKLIVATAIALVIALGLLLVSDAVKGVPLSLWYRPKVTSNFNRDFNDINPYLTTGYGIHFQNASKQKDCGPASGYPSGGKTIFTCSLTVRADPVAANETFVKKWQETSPKLEQYLLAKGWQKEWNKAQPITRFLVTSIVVAV